MSEEQNNQAGVGASEEEIIKAIEVCDDVEALKVYLHPSAAVMDAVAKRLADLEEPITETAVGVPLQNGNVSATEAAAGYPAAPEAPAEATPVAETAATTADTSVVDINHEEEPEEFADEDLNPPVTEARSMTQAERDLAILAEAQEIRQNPERFKAARAIAGVHIIG